MPIPEKGLDKAAVFEKLTAFGQNDLDTHGGQVWAYVYDTGRPEVGEVAREAFLQYMDVNSLDPTVYPSALQLECDVIRMSADHLRGDEKVVGHFTSGGTESCIMAVKAARGYAREHKPHITDPEIVLPVTAHAAFHKACDLMNLKKVLVPVDPNTYKADVDALREAITENTILMVGSAVSYAHGVIDPIPEMGQLALEKDILLHVDGCIGGFILPYFRRLGEPVTDFDFSVPGVTSISMDYHKYGYTPKGASVVVFRDKTIRKHMIWACKEWTGYTVINPTLQSTKSTGSLAACWAVLNYLGDDGYLDIARRTLEAKQIILPALKKMPYIRVMGEPESSLIAFTSDELNVFHVTDEMKQAGWYIQPQLTGFGSKENVHLSLTAVSLDRCEQMLADLPAALERAKALSDREDPEAIGAMLSAIDFESMDSAGFQEMLGMVGIAGTALPERLAQINSLMNQLPIKVAERILVEFFNELYV